MKLRFVIFITLIGGFYLPVKAQFGQAVWDTLTTDTLQEVITSQGIAVNGYEQFHLAYGKQRAGGGFNICYRYFDLYNGAYPEVVVESNQICSAPVIASRFGDEYSDIAILFEAGNEIWKGVVNGPQEPWTFENITRSGDPEFSPTVSYGSHYLHGAWITYTNSTYKIAYMKSDGDSNSIEIINASNLGQFGSGAAPFIVAPLDVPHIFYRGVNGDFYHIHHAYKVSPDSDWTIEYILTPNVDDYTASAGIDIVGNIFLAISGNAGFGFPGRVYYTRRDSYTGQWSRNVLVTGSNSAVNASLMARETGRVFIASCGVSGNIYDGNVYLSTDTSGSFQTSLMGSYRSCTQPVIANIIDEYGVLIFDAPIGGELSRNIELVYFGPQMNNVAVNEPLLVSPSMTFCFPNPFNSKTSISFTLERPSIASIDVFDITGRKVAQIANGQLGAGEHEVVWDARNASSGIYFYNIKAGNFTDTKKMMLLK